MVQPMGSTSVQHWQAECALLAVLTIGVAFLVAGTSRFVTLVCIAIFLLICAGASHWAGSFETSRAFSLIAHDFSGHALPLRVQIGDLIVKAWAVWTPLLLVLLLFAADAASRPASAQSRRN